MPQHRPTSEGLPDVGSDAVQRQITELLAMTGHEFAETVVAEIKPLRNEPVDPVFLAAVRSPQVRRHAVVALAAAITSITEQIERARKAVASLPASHPEKSRHAEWHRRADSLRQALGAERNFINVLIKAEDEENGVTHGAPNPRRAAWQRLANENLRGDVRKGRFTQLIDEERRRAANRKRRGPGAR